MNKKQDQNSLAKPSLSQSTGGKSDPQQKIAFSYSQHLLPIFLIFIISSIIYANTLNNGFVYDDEYTVVDNTLIKGIDNLPKLFSTADYFARSGEQSYRPVVTFTYFVDYALYGLKPWGYHLTNILLHATNGVLLYAFMALIIQPSEVSGRRSVLTHLFSNLPFIISLLFVSNPVLTEAVNAISFREDLLVFHFYMATLLLYVYFRDNAHRTYLLYAISCLTYAIALFSKEMAVTLPLIIYCYEWFYADKKEKEIRSLLFNRFIIGYLLITLCYLYIRFAVFQIPHEEIETWVLGERLSTIPYLIMKYLYLLIFPYSLSADYVIPPVNLFSLTFIFYLLTVVSILATIFQLNKTIRDIGFGGTFFILTLLPVYSIIPINNPFAERYLYLPSVGFVIVVTMVLNLALKAQARYIAVFLLFVLCSNSLAVINRNGTWNDNYSLWSNTVEKMPNSSRAHYGLGTSYNSQGKQNEALQHLQAALIINPSNVDVLNNIGTIYAEQGNLDFAMQNLNYALKLKPNHATTHNNIGNIYLRQGRHDEAIQEYKSALKLKPVYVKAHYNLGNAYFAKGLYNNAKEEYQRTLSYNPQDTEAHLNLGSTYAAQGLIDNAIAEFLEAARLKPDDSQIQMNIERADKIKMEKGR